MKTKQSAVTSTYGSLFREPLLVDSDGKSMWETNDSIGIQAAHLSACAISLCLHYQRDWDNVSKSFFSQCLAMPLCSHLKEKWRAMAAYIVRIYIRAFSLGAQIEVITRALFREVTSEYDSKDGRFFFRSLFQGECLIFFFFEGGG